MVPCEAFWHMDTTNCNLSKIGSKIIAIRFFETWNRILKACIALKPEGDEKWIPRNSINSDQLYLTSTRHFWKMYRNWKFQNFQIYGFYDFFSSKAWNLPKTLKILFFVLYYIAYIQNTGNGNNLSNLPINKNIMRSFFLESIYAHISYNVYMDDIKHKHIYRSRIRPVSRYRVIDLSTTR